MVRGVGKGLTNILDWMESRAVGCSEKLVRLLSNDDRNIIQTNLASQRCVHTSIVLVHGKCWVCESVAKSGHIAVAALTLSVFVCCHYHPHVSSCSSAQRPP
jgi:hypothetical protein